MPFRPEHVLVVTLAWLAVEASSSDQCLSPGNCYSLLQKSKTTVLRVAADATDAADEEVIRHPRNQSKAGPQYACAHCNNRSADMATTNSEAAKMDAKRLLKKAVADDPSNSKTITLDTSALATGGWCYGRSCAIPQCSTVGRELHLDFGRGLDCSTKNYGVPTKNRTDYETNDFYWDDVLQTSADGKLCRVCESQHNAAPGPVSFVLDQTAYADFAAPLKNCPDFAERGSSKKTYETFAKKLVDDGKAYRRRFKFNYTVDNSIHNGSLNYVVVWPESCPEEGCTTQLYLHGVKEFQFESLDLAEDTALLRIVGTISDTMFDMFCEPAYKRLRQVMVFPILDSETFPAAAEYFTKEIPSPDVYMESLCKTNYTWANTHVDILDDAIIPMLSLFLSTNTGMVNPNKVHVNGLSMGAIGSALAAFRYPDLFVTATAFSPCNTESSNFPADVYSWMSLMREPHGIGNRKMERLMLFIGEGDDLYVTAGGAACANEWAKILAQSPLIDPSGNPAFEVELRFVVNRDVGNETQTMDHLQVVYAAMGEVDDVLWEEAVPGSVKPYLAPAYGCAGDVSWVPFAFLLVLLIIYMAIEHVTKYAVRTKPAVDTVVGAVAKQAKTERTPTLAQAQLRVTPRQVRTLSELFYAARPNAVALLTTRSKDVVTYEALRSFLSTAETVAALPQGFRYAICLPAGHSLACVLLATIQRGTAVPLDPAMTEEELITACKQMKAQAIISLADESGQHARAVSSKLNMKFIECDVSQAMPVLRSVGSFPYASSKQAWDPDSEERVVLLLRTSGTTSKGRVVPFSFARLARASQYNAACIGLGPGQMCLSMMPLYHIAGISVNLLPSLFAGASVLILGGTFDAQHFVEQLERKSGPEGSTPTWYFAVPSVHAGVIQESQRLGRTLKHQLRLIRSAGAALDPALGKEMVSFFGASVTPCYGMTEACEITCPPMDYQVERDGSVGPAMTCQIKIDTAIDPTSCSGEICVKGDLLMKGYEWDGPDDEDPNLVAWTEDGFLRTGDVGHLDAGGWLYLTGRSKEMINRGGETLSPYEVEDTLQSAPGLAFSLAFAAPHASLGECMGIACVLKEGIAPQDLPLNAILQECANRGLRPVMRPEVVIYCRQEALPMTRTKKYIRAGLAGKLGLIDAQMIESCRAFLHTSSGLEAAPEADDADGGLILRDSMGQLQTATRTAVIMQNVTNSLYGIAIVNVMLNHWLPHSLNETGLAVWAKVAFTTFRSDKALMGLVFLLGGHSMATWDKGSIGKRLGIFVAIYMAMGWPYLFESTQGIATFHRWFIYWLVVCIAVTQFLDWIEFPPVAGIFMAFTLACVLSDVPDNLGSHLVPNHPFVMDEYHYWSIGHKLYWLGFFFIGFNYGHEAPHLIERAPAWFKENLQRVPLRLAALLVAMTVAFLSVNLDVAHDELLEPSLQDWPRFFNVAFPLKLAAELMQLAFLAVAVQQGGTLLQMLGASILGTFMVHMYLDTGIKAYCESRLFQALDVYPPFGGALQLMLLFAYPVVFGLTVGRFAMFLFVQVSAGSLSRKDA